MSLTSGDADGFGTSLTEIRIAFLTEGATV
jgi:hypothetical protein